MGYIANLRSNYFEILKNEGLQNSIAAVVENAISALMDEVDYRLDSMDDVELDIVLDYYQKNRKYMEE